MTMKLFTVWDAKAEAYLQPFFCPTKGQALRSFSAAVNKPDHDLHLYAEDYSLFEIGEWDDSTGIITMLEHRIPLGGAHEFLKTNSVPNRTDIKVVGGPA